MVAVGLGHKYANDVVARVRSDDQLKALNPIGLSVEANSIDAKPQQLRESLAGVDLRKISPSAIIKLAVNLHEAGEISNNATASIIVAMGEQGSGDEPMDAIAHFEIHWKRAEQLAAESQEYAETERIYGDTLHTLYNIDLFVGGSRKEIGIHEVV